MQAAYHVHLGHAQEKARPRTARDDFVDSIFKRVRVAFPGCKRAELAGENADVRVIDVAIVDVGREVTVFPLAHDVRDHSKRVEIVCAVKDESVRF